MLYAVAAFLTALTFALLAYIANRKRHHGMAALAAAAWLFGAAGGVLIWLWR